MFEVCGGSLCNNCFIFFYTWLMLHIYIALLLRCTVRGVFKKRKNFLNSALTSTESALRQLSTPCVKFWQQTAICLVLLWALIVELHPLNWACAQAVRQISDKVTMKELEEQCVCTKFCCKLGKNFMGMMLKPRCNHRSGWGKGLLDQKKHGWVGQKSRCYWLCFWLSIMNLYHVVRW